MIIMTLLLRFRTRSYHDNMGQFPCITGITAGRFVHEITLLGSPAAKNNPANTKSYSHMAIGLHSVPIPEFAVYRDLFFNSSSNPFRVLVPSLSWSV